jgi:hypothetical protein
VTKKQRPLGLPRRALARRLHTSESTIDRLIADGLQPAGTRGAAKLYDVATARRRLKARRPARVPPTERERLLGEQTADVREALASEVRTHVPAALAAQLQADFRRHAREGLAAAIPGVAARLAARLRGEVTDPPADPRLMPDSREHLRQAPRSALAVRLAAECEVYDVLTALAATPPQPGRHDADLNAAAEPWLTTSEGLSQRGVLATWRLRRDRFRRARARGEWLPLATVEADLVRWATEARVKLHDRWPRAVGALGDRAHAGAIIPESEIAEALRGTLDEVLV